MAKVEFRGVTLDSRTARMMEVVAMRTGPKIIPTQGSFNTSVDASAGTHSAAGAIDLSVKGLDAPRVNAIVKVMRQVGFAAWHRLVSEGPWPAHIHGIAVNAPGLSTAAAKQVAALRRGRNGLANDGLDRHRNMNLPVITFEQFLADTTMEDDVTVEELLNFEISTGQGKFKVATLLANAALLPVIKAKGDALAAQIAEIESKLPA
jgi:hypothetical protein